MSGIPLKEWIDGTVNCTDCSSNHNSQPLFSAALSPDAKRSLAVLSDPYLFSALKIAYSLANQLCQAEDFYRKSGFSRCLEDGPALLPESYQLPSAGHDWSDRIAIFLTPLAPSPSKSIDEDCPSTVSPSLNNIDLKFNAAVSERNDEKKCNETHPVPNGDPCLSVQRAEILSGSKTTYNRGKLEDEDGRLYSLGIVFYELFSGGKTPPLEPDERLQSDDLFNPLSVDEADSIDLTSALQILDKLGDDDDGAYKAINEKTQPEHDPDERGKKPRPSHNESGQQLRGGGKKISVEPLRLQHLPAAICDLIDNMVDSVNGDFRANESYCHMSDVVADLRLMLEKPDKFLRDRDMSKLATSSLQFDDSLFGRDTEFSSLLSAYQRSINGDHEMAIIAGPSGTGKSYLAHRLAQVVSKGGGIFLLGKFDQQMHTKPFSAISTAFNEYCDALVQSGDPEQVAIVSHQLKRALGQDIFHLIKVIPNLSKIVEPSNSSKGPIQLECVDAEKRLQYFLCRFVEVISTSAAVPVVLVLDDLQWADTSSISVINQLLLNSGSLNQVSNFFFIGCYRDDEIGEGHPVQKMISRAQSFDVRVTKIVLRCMQKEEINTVVSDLLCISPRLTRPLSEIIYHKTKGNPLFYSTLMLSLCKEGILRVNLARCKWEWDEAMIQSRELPDDVASFFTGMICKLPHEVQAAMSVLACFRAATDYSLIKTLEAKLGLNLIAPLEVAVTEGFLDKKGVNYCFSHDRYQDAALSMMSPSIRTSRHFEYGLALSEDADSRFLFTSVGQLNLAGPSAAGDSDKRTKVANLNLLAGCKAMDMSDFTSAFYFFQHGITFLPENHWVNNYDLSLRLFEGAAKCSLVIPDFASLKSLTEQVTENSRSFEDQLNTLYASMIAFSYSLTHSELVDKGISILKKLDIDLPNSNLNFHLEQTRLMFSRYTFDELLNFKVMIDHQKIMAMKFMSRIQIPLAFLKSDRQPFLVLTMVQMSLIHGLSPMSPLCFAYFGGLLPKCGYEEEGYSIVQFAKTLVRRDGFKEMSGEVYAITTMADLSVKPMQSVNDNFLDGCNAAMSVGDLDQAMLNMRLYSTSHFWIGSKLQTVRDHIANVCNLMRRHNHLTWIVNLKPMERTVAVLVEGANIETEPIDGHAEHINFHLMYANYIFGNYDEARENAEKYFYSKRKLVFRSMYDSQFNFYDGLISFWIYRLTKDSTWAHRGRQSVSFICSLVEDSQWNWENKLFLLQAEEHFCENDHCQAESFYNKAITSSRKHKFIHEEAIACELAATFFLEIGKKERAQQFFAKAHEAYQKWGAFAKATSLYEYILKSFGSFANGSSL